MSDINEMKALSIRQPWAWLIVNGYKPIENRSWKTKFRGKFLIHAPKKIDREAIEYINEVHPNIILPDEYETGGIVGQANLVDCVTDSHSPWFFGDYGFVLESRSILPFMPCKGMLSFFKPKFDNKPIMEIENYFWLDAGPWMTLTKGHVDKLEFAIEVMKDDISKEILDDAELKISDVDIEHLYIREMTPKEYEDSFGDEGDKMYVDCEKDDEGAEAITAIVYEFTG